MNYKNSLLVSVLLLINPLITRAMDKIQDAQALPAPTAAELDRTPDGVILDTGHWIYFLDAKGMPLIQELNPEENPLNHVRHECRRF